MKLQRFLNNAWDDYVRLTPDAPLIHDLLVSRGDVIVNDHVAIRTFNLPGIGRRNLGAFFELWGCKPQEDLVFPEKRLTATYYRHEDSSVPKIFISELLVEQFSGDLQQWVRELAAQALLRHTNIGPSLLLEPNWDPVRYEDYQRFYAESEYAAWTAAFGIRVNHFTVLVNALKSMESLQELNVLLQASGIALNASGGLIKGSPAEMLEQSSTMARSIPWEFAGGVRHEIPGCYYEFARRYALPGSRELFQGFVPRSADKIFESTSK